MSARVVLVRCDDRPPSLPSPHRPPSDPLLRGLSQEFLYKNRRLLSLCRPVSPVLERVRVGDGRVGGGGDARVGGGGDGGSRPPKRVQLPDIAEVRRLNRQLLTAQVAPINAVGEVGGLCMIRRGIIVVGSPPHDDNYTIIEMNLKKNFF